MFTSNEVRIFVFSQVDKKNLIDLNPILCGLQSVYDITITDN